jgi:hypothetical protein
MGRSGPFRAFSGLLGPEKAKHCEAKEQTPLISVKGAWLHTPSHAMLCLRKLLLFREALLYFAC